jgi:hypothetical protein
LSACGEEVWLVTLETRPNARQATVRRVLGSDGAIATEELRDAPVGTPDGLPRAVPITACSADLRVVAYPIFDQPTSAMILHTWPR